MVYVEIKNMARRYGVWRKQELAKQEQPGTRSNNPAAYPKIPTWKEWKSKATKATSKLKQDIRKGNPIEFNPEVWKTLKGFLKYLFHGKCAYCEGRFTAGSYLDVEHYRPKAKVTLARSNDSVVKITAPGGGEIPHPGYYWLAYDPSNLLLACEKCNRGAKASQFPIRGSRACRPGDSLEAESPLLLNPYRETNMMGHFSVFDENSGFLEGRTEEGKKTVEICNLCREDLVNARREEWEKLRLELFRRYLDQDNRTSKAGMDEMPYSLYLKLALKAAASKIAASMD